MNIVVFGATGHIGQRLVARALEDNHTVTAFVREKSRLRVSDDNLRIVVGNVLERTSVTAALVGQDVVFCALGTCGDLRPTVVLSEGTRHITREMRQYGTKRIVCLLSGWVFANRPPLRLRAVVADHVRQLEVLRQSHLNWVGVCPSQVVECPATGQCRVAVNALPVQGYRIAMDDLVNFMLEQVSSQQYLFQSIGIAN